MSVRRRAESDIAPAVICDADGAVQSPSGYEREWDSIIQQICQSGSVPGSPHTRSPSSCASETQEQIVQATGRQPMHLADALHLALRQQERYLNRSLLTGGCDEPTGLGDRR
jgi:hypothetical protein